MPRFAISQWRSGALIGLFLLVLSLPVLDSVFGFDRAPQPNENRRIAEWPQRPESAKSLRSYFSDIERYYNDHFGFRKQLIRWNNRWRKSLYRDLKGVDVIQGREGWLYFTPGHVMDHLLGQRRFDTPTLEALRREFEARANWLAEKKITYVMVVAPNKETIYPEFLPEWLVPQIHHPSKLDQFLDYMREHSFVTVVDVRPALKAAKQKHEVYLKTDSHWNKLGAYVATRAVLEAVAAKRPDFPKIYSVDELQLNPIQRDAGDAAGMIGRMDLQDVDWQMAPPPPDLAITPRTDPSLSDRTWPDAARPVLTENPARQYGLVMFHDSFGSAMASHFGLYFKRAAFIFQYLWSYRDAPLSWSPEVVEHERPDVVIDEIVERALLEMTAQRVGGMSVTPAP